MLKAFATVLAYAGVCALLVVIGSHAGTARGETGWLATDTRSALSADYSTRLRVPILSPLKPEIVVAAAQDNLALRLIETPGAGRPEARARPAASSSSAAPAGSNAIQPATASDGGASPASPALAEETAAASPGRDGLPVALVLTALLVTTGLAWGACHVLKPRPD